MAPFVPSVIVISGASSGFGLACAAELSKQCPCAKLHLVASAIDGLAVSKGVVSGHGGGVTCHGFDLAMLAAGDMSGTTELTSCLSQSTKGQKVLFVHCATAMGPAGAIEKLGLKAIAAISQAVQVNVAGSLALAVLLASSLPSGLQDLHCVNVSSRAAVIQGAFDVFDVMTVTKPAVQSMFSLMANRGARVLQFCTGPVKTDMTVDQQASGWPWVKLEESAQIMAALIKDNSYDNNACLDDGLALSVAAAPGGELAPAPGTPPRNGVLPEALLVPGATRSSAEARGSPPLLRKCMITRIEAFSSSHVLKNCSWSDSKNKDTFGKCTNLHGHNYKVEFSFSGFIDPDTGMVANLSTIKLILQEFLGRLDHSHLNDHVDIFKNAPTTAEVISQVLFEEIAVKVAAAGLSAELVKVKVWETDKNIAVYPY